MSLLDGIQDKRHYEVSEEKAFVLSTGEPIRTLDELSEAINFIEPEIFRAHVNEQKNDFANWVDHVFGEEELAQQLREFPTPLRMMVAIEKFLRRHEVDMENNMPAATTMSAPSAMPAAEGDVVETITQN
jgi:hypothetical protein